jgi:hypothetical protein
MAVAGPFGHLNESLRAGHRSAGATIAMEMLAFFHPASAPDLAVADGVAGTRSIPFPRRMLALELANVRSNDFTDAPFFDGAKPLEADKDQQPGQSGDDRRRLGNSGRRYHHRPRGAGERNG